jgi:hypothetical protein
MTLPTFLGIGVPRGGTTWLHEWLAGHPDVYMPTRRKEVRFFDRHYDRGLGWYEAYFSPAANGARYRAIGEISPQYLYCEDCPRRISAVLPGVRLLLTLRHPVDRAYSNYGFLVQRRNYRGSFSEFLATRPLALEKGFYGRYVQRYLRHFDRDQILPLVFEETFADLARTERRVGEFLEIGPDRFPPSAGTRTVNASTVPSFGALSAVAVKTGRRLRRWQLEPLVDFGRRLGVQKAIAKGTPIARLDPETRQQLSVRFYRDFDELERSLDVDLTRWRT